MPQQVTPISQRRITKSCLSHDNWWLERKLITQQDIEVKSLNTILLDGKRSLGDLELWNRRKSKMVRLVLINRFAWLWETYINDTTKCCLLLTEFVLVGKIAEQKELLFYSFVLGSGYLGRPALIRPNSLLGHIDDLLNFYNSNLFKRKI